MYKPGYIKIHEFSSLKDNQKEYEKSNYKQEKVLATRIMSHYI